MSTRCNIIVKENYGEIILYHHHDGYPSGVGADLKKYLEEYRKDSQWGWDGMEIATALIRMTAIPEDDEYRPTFGLHGDIDYVYVIDCPAKELRCYRVGCEDTDIRACISPSHQVEL